MPQTDLSQCNISGIEAFLIKCQVRWCGHVVRMGEERIPKQLFYGQIHDSSRREGRPLLRYKDKLKDNLKRIEIDVGNWENLAADRKAWRTSCFSKLSNFEKRRTKHHDTLRANMKSRNINNPVGPDHRCTVCGFIARSKAGLAVHARTHITSEPANLICTICNRTCKTTGGLKVHMRTHQMN